MAATEGDAIYFDGESSRRRIVRARLADRLELVEQGLTIAIWRWDAIRRADGGRGVARFSCREAAELARLDVADTAFAAEIAARCASLDGEGAAHSGNLRAIIGWSLAAALSIALIAIFGVPAIAARLTDLIPRGVEAKLGDAVAGQVDAIFGGRTCDEPQGAAAFDKLAGTLWSVGDFPAPVKISVRQSVVPNAFAIPGDRVYVLSALIDKADNADELAGVIAHEFGHVAHRDGLREMISSGGSAFLFGLLLGDVTGSGAVLIASRTMLNAAHSREAEANADAFAARAMLRLGRSPAPLGEFLLRMTGQQQGGAMALLASHPLTQDRLAELKRLDAHVTAAPLLTDGEWKALKGICAK